ncbi:uncharacterized protein F5147DRAFT_690611 [Suillus discolor]|uniref:Uncharacterized protein n=1 Tax=Suillus discolor TaxID=1912936 RepID=A0A9P7F7Y9_9AGAM|nr:uncharacterized protein F5147DRAFT_690611 [Suillus discolor]KAG2109867.1 hypothetical protein F5147DRAFT_690611 [Suillus discolor]
MRITLKHDSTAPFFYTSPYSMPLSTTSRLVPHHQPMFLAHKRQRRTATSVLAGDFDLRPPRDVLTSLLNGVAPYKEVEKEEETRRTKKKEKRERLKEKQRTKATSKVPEKPIKVESATAPPPAPIVAIQSISAPAVQTSSFWRARGTSHRPTIHIATMQRSVSVTPPPMASSPQSTPGPSVSSATSRTSSKRPRTPADDYPDSDAFIHYRSAPQPRKKRIAVKKGWKGWVEGSPAPSEKLINLDAVPVLQERRTRSGKSFDAIGVGKDGWV